MAKKVTVSGEILGKSKLRKNLRSLQEEAGFDPKIHGSFAEYKRVRNGDNLHALPEKLERVKEG